MAFGGDNQHIPNGWLLCDGSEVDNTDPLFINLFNVIGYNWGTSNHSNLFNLPDARGVFLRGVTYGGASDPEADLRMPSANGANGGNAVGSLQVDDLKSHTHRMNYSLGAYFGWAGGWGGIGEFIQYMLLPTGAQQTIFQRQLAEQKPALKIST